MLFFLKTLNLRLGVFFVLIFCQNAGFAEAITRQCSVDVSRLQKATLAHVIDGDTLKLKNGSNVRLIAVNTPELFNQAPALSLLAKQAKRAVTSFFNGSNEVYLQMGREVIDRYGRRLAHVYRHDGASLSAYLLSQGLAWQVLVPPNDRYASCYANIEKQTRQKKWGVWAVSFLPLVASALEARHAGFTLVKGRVKKVSRSSKGWWIEMGRLAIFIKNEDTANFQTSHFNKLLNQELLIKGWVIDRSDSKSVLKNAYPPFMMYWRHPTMLL
ncbi:MAG: endonuclease YncB(thermonuclease family) [Pseudohongiellaceae bacterium]|jgi:endonuclease YncB( thermonuclease family)